MAISIDSIKRTTSMSAPRILIYGEAGIGKTTFAAGAPNPVFIFTEDGAGTLSVDAFPKVNTFSDVMDAIAVLYQEDHNYQTVVIDSLDFCEPLIWAEVCAEHNVKSVESVPYGKAYVEALSYWRQLLDGLNALRDQKGMCVVLIAHHQIKRFESPEHDSIDRYDIKLHAKASALVQESVDVIGFAKPRTVIKTEQLGFGNTRTRGVTTGERVLAVSGTAAYVAKNRYALPPELPLTWSAFADAISAAKQAAA